MDKLVHRYAVILTHNRHELLRRCVAALAPQVSDICIIDNASDPPVAFDAFGPSLVRTIIHDPMQPPNLAALMNSGFEWAARSAAQWSYAEWDVAVLCDDVEAPDGWYDAVAGCIRQMGVVAGSTHQIQAVASPLIKHSPDNDICNRMQGSAFIMRGEVGLRADEDMHWWWQDTDLDWQARCAGGMVIAPGPIAVNSRPNDFTVSRPELNEQAGRDGEVFARKWGSRPW